MWVKPGLEMYQQPGPSGFWLISKVISRHPSGKSARKVSPAWIPRPLSSKRGCTVCLAVGDVRAVEAVLDGHVLLGFRIGAHEEKKWLKKIAQKSDLLKNPKPQRGRK